MPSTEPFHERVAANLRSQIAAGELGVGDPIPSESRLCAAFGVSRGTVRQALAALRAEELIAGGRGKPPVVRPQPLSQPFEALLSFSAWAEALGRVPGQRTLEIAWRRAEAGLAEALALTQGTPVIQLVRLRLLDDEPAMIERTSFVEGVGRLLLDFDCDSGSIFAYLRSRGVELARARHVIEAVAADELDARLLGVPVGAPLLRERRRTTTAGGEPIEWSDDRYLPKLVTISIENAAAPARPALARAEAA